MQNNHHLNDNKKLLLRNKREFQAKQAKLERILKSGILNKLKNVQGFILKKKKRIHAIQCVDSFFYKKI